MPFAKSFLAAVCGTDGSMAFFHNTADRLSAAFQIAKRIYALAQRQNEPAMMVRVCTALTMTIFSWAV